MEPVQIYTQQKIVRPRVMVSVGLTIMGLLPLIWIYRVLGTLNFLHPITFLSGIFGGIFTTFCSWILVALVMFSVLALRANRYKVVNEKMCCRADNLSLALNLKAISVALVHCLSSFLVASVLMWSIGGRYEDLIINCDSQRCLNEHKWFGVQFAALVGFLWSWNLSAFGGECLTFPSTEAPVVKRLKEEIPDILKSSTKLTRRVFLIYCPAYFVVGQCSVWVLKKLLFLHSSETSEFSSWWSIVDVRLFYQTYILGVFVTLSWSLGHFLFQACMTKHASYEMVDAKGEGSIMAALELKEDSLAKILAFKDLHQLSARSGDVRRQKIFSLSNPGGHPKVWKAVSAVTMSQLQELLNRIETSNKELVESYKSIMPRQAGSKIETLKPGYNSSPKSSQPSQVFYCMTESAITYCELFTVHLFIVAILVAKKWYYPAFLYQQYPEKLSAKLFYDSQKHIWCVVLLEHVNTLKFVTALSDLITRSLTEDKYGIVQQNLGEIINLLISLTRTIECLFRVSTVTGKRSTEPYVNRSSHSLGIELYSQLKSSLHSIAATFQPHIRSNTNSYLVNLCTNYTK
ncbi:NDC1 [Bugula neritina]|uniref:NDC1 n=1 Tax=Bugula neritina TaxID=10212 RepID=A0A7J7J228_BUGNE|nr:NDC1 [Bugula neritina]